MFFCLFLHRKNIHHNHAFNQPWDWRWKVHNSSLGYVQSKFNFSLLLLFYIVTGNKFIQYILVYIRCDVYSFIFLFCSYRMGSLSIPSFQKFFTSSLNWTHWTNHRCMKTYLWVHEWLSWTKIISDHHLEVVIETTFKFPFDCNLLFNSIIAVTE